jgi:hypothetical protein
VGAQATGWATAVTNALNNIQNPTDIPQTTYNLSNNISTPTNIPGLAFNTGLVRAAFVDYSIYRTAPGQLSGISEAGQMIFLYDNLASSGSLWQVTGGPIDGNSGVTLTITDQGQVQYTSTNIPSSTMVIHFSAKTLNQ